MLDHLYSIHNKPERLKAWAKEVVKTIQVWRTGESVNPLWEDWQGEDENWPSDKEFQQEIYNLMSQDLNDEDFINALTNVKRAWRKGKGKGDWSGKGKGKGKFGWQPKWGMGGKEGKGKGSIRCLNCGKKTIPYKIVGVP